jgi:hypothetical protein
VNVSATKLIADLSTVIDPTLAKQVVESYVEMERRFIAGDRQPAELNGGRLCEAASRCLYQLDTGIVSHTKEVAAIRTALRDNGNGRTHALGPRERVHTTGMIEMVYGFRSDRGAVHISKDYSANQMDSVLVLHAGKWIFAELLRLALKKDEKAVAETIAQIVQLEHSIIHVLDGKPMVLAREISAPEEVLVLLSNADGKRLSRAKLREFAPNQKPDTVNAAVKRLLGSKDIRVADDGNVVLTPNGEKKLIETIMPKLAKPR